MNQSASDSTVHSDGLTCFVSIESAVLYESFYMNDSVSHLLKQGLAAKVQTQKTHSAKYCLIINIDQNVSIAGLRKKKKPYKHWFI